MVRLNISTLAKKAGPIEAGSDVYQTTRSIYDEAGNVVKVLLPNQFVPPAGSQSEAWEITMEYDFLGQMTRQTHPDSGTVQYIYDIAGRPRFMVDAVGLESGTILYKKYDVIGRLIEEGWFSGNWGDGTTLHQKAHTDPNYPEQGNWRKRYIFDGDGSNPYLVGRLWKVLSSNQGDGNADVEEVYDYDQFGNAIAKTLKVEGYPAEIVKYEYDNLNKVTKVSYPENSSIPEVVNSYNSVGETIAEGTPDNPQRFATYSYNADGSIATTGLNNAGIIRNLNYNSPGFPTEIANQKTDNSLVMQQSLTYTSDGYGGSGYYNGNIAKNSINYGNWDNSSRNYHYQYQYDNLGRLQVAQNSQDTGASLGVGQPTIYDINGNIETLKRGETSNQYEYIQNTDKVKDVTDSSNSEPQSYSYDANGNVKTASHRHISQIDYDPLTQLTTQIKLQGEKSGTVSFKYDTGNQRVLKTSEDSSGNQTAAKLYVHGLNDYPLLEVSDESVQYIYGIGGLLALVKDGKVYTVLKDHLGSTRLVVDEAGTIITAFDYLPFGDLMGTAYGNPEIISYRYTGQEFDAELGLYNYRARFYDPSLGRFYATDPKGQFASTYLYAGNNPIVMVDPDGKIAFLAIVGIGLLVGAVAGGTVGGVKAAQQGLSGGEAAGEIFKWAGIGAVGGGLIAATAGTFAATGFGASITGVTSIASVSTISAATGAGIAGGTAAYNANQQGLSGWDAAEYIGGSVAIGAVAGGLTGAAGVGAYAAGAGAVAATGATSTLAIVGGGAVTGAGVGALAGAGIGAASAAAQFGLDEAYGVGNQFSLSETVWRGAVVGAIAGAVSGAFLGRVGAATNRAASAISPGVQNTWQNAMRNAVTTHVSASSSFGTKTFKVAQSFIPFAAEYVTGYATYRDWFWFV